MCKLQSYSCASYKYAKLRVCKATSVQATNMQSYKCAKLQVCKLTPASQAFVFHFCEGAGLYVGLAGTMHLYKYTNGEYTILSEDIHTIFSEDIYYNT